MTIMTKIGDSLDKKTTLEMRARKTLTRHDRDRSCPACNRPVLPRGYDSGTGKCWFCILPR